MLVEYMKRLTSPKEECPVVLSITTTVETHRTETVIHRNHVTDRAGSADIYVRARNIYYRARRHRPVRAASIF